MNQPAKPSRLVSQRQLAKLLHTTAKTIASWREQGMPYVQRGGEGRRYAYSLDTCREWRDQHRRRGSDALARARTERAVAEAKLLKIEVAELEGNLFEASVLDETISYLRERLSFRMRGLGAHVAAQVAGLTSQQEKQLRDLCSRMMSSAIAAAFDGLKLPRSARRHGNGHDKKEIIS
jgi:phage terminase Nu1 subunit (DNA packaging protein)